MTAALGFLAASIESPEWFEKPWDSGRNPDLWLYRQRTAALLRRFFRMSVEMGKLPSILGQEFFRSKVTSYKASSFEDVVIFVHDVERSLGRLDRLSQALIGRVVLQGFSHEEAGRLLGLCRKTVERRLPDALDKLSEIFLEVGILKPVADPAELVQELCQEGENDEELVIM
jgi:DNA-directed RNA polymerase specialized sigma24 family protein